MDAKELDKQYYETLDNVLNVAVYNLYSISKDGTIKFSDVRFDDDKHWVMLNLISAMCDVWDRQVQLDMGFFDFIKTKLKIRNKRFKRVRHNGGMKMDQFIWDIEGANEHLIDPFENIAKDYYPRKAKKL